MERQSGLSELSVISWVSAFEGCPLGGVPLYTNSGLVMSFGAMHFGEKVGQGGSWV